MPRTISLVCDGAGRSFFYGVYVRKSRRPIEPDLGPRKHPETYQEFLDAWNTEHERKVREARRELNLDPPLKRSRTKYIRDWDKYTFDLVNRDDIDHDRMQHWFKQWTQPGGDQIGFRIFFGILAHEEQFRVTDFDWVKFRLDYLAVYPEKRPQYRRRRKGK